MRFRMNMALVGLMLCMVQTCMAASAPQTPGQPPPTFQGPFEMRQFLVMYVVNPTGDEFSINLRWRDEYRSQMDRPILVRVFNPGEHVLVHQDEPGEKGGPLEQTATIQVPASGAGVYQVAITGFNASIDFATEPSLSFGLYGYPDLACRDQQFANAFVYLPPKLDSLLVRCGGDMQSVTLLDESGGQKVQINGTGASASSLPTDGEHIWRLSAVAKGVGTLNFAGMPIILCPDASSARAIHASVDVLNDGTICFHKCQVRAHEILKRYRGMPPSSFAVTSPVLVRQKQAWLADPVRNQALLGAYGVFSGLDVTLAEQVLDGASPWFGCIHPPRDAQGRPSSDNPWSSYTRLGIARAAPTIGTLAAVYSVHEPFNPLAGDQALRNRVIIAALQELMLLREHELPFQEFIEYQGGERAFTFARATLAFPLVVRECPEDVRAVWTEGMRRWVDHESISSVALTANQWTFIIRAIQQFREGVDDPWYASLVRRHVRWLLTRNQGGYGLMPAGYLIESGPDATYSGISLHNLGWVARRTNDADLIAALRKTYVLFNHTVAPEPDGSWIGATNFCSRTPNDWSKPQWTAGISMLAGEIAEASPSFGHAMFSQPPPVDAEMLRFAEQQTNSMLTSLDRHAFDKFSANLLSDASDIGFVVWQAYAENPLFARLPVLESASFTRAFGDEFMCVRRPAYYCFVYAGAPMAEWQKQGRERNTRKQYPRNGGGLCMFWSPSMGTTLLGKNWSAYAAQTIIAERDRTTGDGDWEDYWSVHSDFDVVNACATITSTILNQPIHVRRHFEFLTDRVRCDVQLKVDAQSDASRVWECFPYTLDKAKPLQVVLLNDRGETVSTGPASAIMFSQGGEDAHLVVFAQPRVCDVGVEYTIDHYDNPRRHGRVLAEISDALRPGQTEVSWVMLPVSGNARNAVIEALRQLRKPPGE